MNQFKTATLISVISVLCTVSYADAPACYRDRFIRPTMPGKKSDLSLIIDTSQSLNDNRERVAKQIGNFIQAFPKGVDIQIGVILAHGYDSPYAGVYYRAAREPVII